MTFLAINPKIKNIIFLFAIIGLIWSLKLYSSDFKQLLKEKPSDLSLNQTFSEEEGEENDKDSSEFDYFILGNSSNKILKSEQKLNAKNCIVGLKSNSSISTPPPNFS
jgi:hypothetical protein